MSTEITYEQLKSKIQDRAGLTLAEVLPAQYYASGHLPGAVHLPLDAVGGPGVTEILPHKNDDIVLYCTGPTCQNSHIAARKLESLGYAKVSVFTGGKAGWTEAGQPLEKTPAPQPAPVVANA